MKEAAWFACQEIEKLLRWLPRLQPAPSARKLRLYCTGICRRLWPQLPELCREAVATAEAFADGSATLEHLTAAHAAARRKHGRSLPVHVLAEMDLARMTRVQVERHGWEATDGATRPARAVPNKTVKAVLLSATIGGGHENLFRTGPETLAFLAAVLHDVLGNPFRPAILDPASRTTTVIGMAQAIYQERSFDRLPILADALEEAGCTNGDLLGHCRGGGHHVRGCWALDAVLDRS